jgi:hypothetical protein
VITSEFKKTRNDSWGINRNKCGCVKQLPRMF